MSGEIDLGIDGIGPATLIGQGGSGRVYRALQPHLDREVAVKIVPTGDDPAIRLPGAVRAGTGGAA